MKWLYCVAHMLNRAVQVALEHTELRKTLLKPAKKIARQVSDQEVLTILYMYLLPPSIPFLPPKHLRPHPNHLPPSPPRSDPKRITVLASQYQAPERQLSSGSDRCVTLSLHPPTCRYSLNGNPLNDKFGISSQGAIEGWKTKG